MTVQTFPGSRWWKFDFHTHTPIGSNDYRGNTNLSAQDWLHAYRANGLDCVVVTDHNSGSWFDELAKALQLLRQQDAQWQSFYVFPGVEISCSGGIHLLAILDTDKTSEDIAGLVGACGYTGRLGDSTAVTTKGFEGVCAVIHQQYKGLAIAAHIDMPKGLLVAQHDETTRLQFLNQVDAVQVVDRNNPILVGEGQESLKKLKVLAQVQGSDNHNAATLSPACFTWVKLTTPDLQGLRLALAEPDLSICRSDQRADDFQAMPKHWIQALSINGLDKRRHPLTIAFNPWLNTVIGGRGSGKSSVVECLRLALGRGDEASRTLGPDHEVSKAVARFRNSMVLPTGQLKTTVSGAGSIGSVYRYDWTPSALSVMRPGAEADSHWIPTDIASTSIPQEFPVRLFSQKQIHALANQRDGLLAYFDESGKSNTAALRKALDDRVTEFKTARVRARALRSELKDWPQVKDQLAQLEQSLAAYAAQGVSDTLLTLQKLGAEKRALNDFQSGLAQDVQRAVSSVSAPLISEWQISLPEAASVAACELAKKWHEERDAMAKQWDSAVQLMAQVQARANSLRTLPEFSAWEGYAAPLEDTCLEALRQIKTQLGGQLQQVGVLQQQKEQLAQTDKLYAAKNQRLQGELAHQLDAYQRLLEARKAITVGRQAFTDSVIGDAQHAVLSIKFKHCAQFDAKSKEVLRDLLKLNHADYANAFLGDLDDDTSTGVMAQLARAPEKLCEFKQTMQALVNLPSSMPEKVLKTPLYGARIREAMKVLSDEQLDALWAWFPEDRVDMRFRATPQDKWQDIGKGSAGQQTGALLSFILNEGDEPLILDQPEDDLDNAMVYDLVVQQLRKNKARRQVIVVTHNANIVVNGDAELVIPMAFRGGQIHADAACGLQNLAIRRTICDVMEGGKIAFNKRYKRVLQDLD